MFSKPLAFGLLALGCVTAAAGGAYVATRHNTAGVAATPTAPAAATAPAPATAQPVAETEAPVAAEKPAPAPEPTLAAPTARAENPKPAATPSVPSRRMTAEKAPEKVKSARTATPPPPAPVAQGRSTSTRDSATPASVDPAPQAPAQSVPTPAPIELPARQPEPAPEAPRVPQFEEVVLPAASVIGLQVETPLSSERARIEDRVEARVTRDVVANGRVAIPAGSRVLGSVTFVDKGGKVKERARLGIRFHTLVLADGTDVALNTEPFYRDGESPAGDSAKKIGGAAIGGAILGAILGGGKGAVVGSTAGAGAGTAAVMAGDRNPATVAAGSIVSVRLSSPVTFQVEKQP